MHLSENLKVATLLATQTPLEKPCLAVEQPGEAVPDPGTAWRVRPVAVFASFLWAVPRVALSPMACPLPPQS